tara:strand:- start:13 stop:627 length:615 start_codon:yes stop_codon:yes gene_type:complete
MKAKEIAIVVGALILIGFGFNYLDTGRADALIAEGKVKVLEAERVELERQVEEAAEGYEVLKDSLDQTHDSIAVIRAEARERASDASRSFEDGVGVLRDSLQAYDGLEEILDGIESNHKEAVEAYEEQILTLEADKALLWVRVEALDSMWIREQEVNQALRNEIVALNEESNAWQRAATPNVFKRLRGAVPYLIVGAGVVLLIR